MGQDRQEPNGEMPLSRGEVLHILEARGNAAREDLAAREDAAPEVLFFLASEGSLKARRAVAANKAAPPHANRLLADDEEGDVRAELARKVGRLLPNLPPDSSEKMRALTIETIEKLAQDQLVRVRRILAEEIKSLDCLPKRIIDRLARDVEEVAAPILEYSPLLSDADLAEIISSAQAKFVLTAIAKRRPLSANISEAIAEGLNVPAVSELLLNTDAKIRAQTLDKIVEHGARITEWHLPLVLRNDLSQRAIRRIAGFVSAALLRQLCERGDLSAETSAQLAKRVRSRIDEDDGLHADPALAAQDEVRELAARGKLTDAFVEMAVEAGKRETVIAALAILVKTTPDTVRRIFQAASAKPVTALVWRANLSMRIAFKIQTFLLKLRGADVLPARAGVHFPLTEDEMIWHLSYFNVN
jgi:uncharacterized protein (DUF2336 family)